MRLFALSLASLALLAPACRPSAADVKDSVQVTVDESGFRPTKIAAKKGRPITLVFTRTVEKTCADEVVIADQNIRKALPLNASVPVTFIPEKSGDLHFACPMNMYGGDIQVIP
jgi:plastocyanin domain-containing protein